MSLETLKNVVVTKLMELKNRPTGKCEKYSAGYIIGVSAAQGIVEKAIRDEEEQGG